MAHKGREPFVFSVVLDQERIFDCFRWTEVALAITAAKTIALTAFKHFPKALAELFETAAN